MRATLGSFRLVGSFFLLATLTAAIGLPRNAAAARHSDDDDRTPVTERLSNIIDPVVLDHVTAKQAFEWWSRSTSIPLVLNWDKMEKDGVDPGTVVTLDLRNVPARQLLTLIMQQASDQPLIYEATQWYVSVTTKAEANRHLVLRMYDVGDLIHDPSPVGEPPRLDLSAALSGNNSSSGGGSGANSGSSSGGSSNSIFGPTPTGQSEKVRGDTERSEDLAKVIRETIEPDIWQENGGKATIRSYKGRLIINAPAYVQVQIGIPEPIHDEPAVNPQYVVVMRPVTDTSSVAGVATHKPSPVAAIAVK